LQFLQRAKNEILILQFYSSEKTSMPAFFDTTVKLIFKALILSMMKFFSNAIKNEYSFSQNKKDYGIKNIFFKIKNVTSIFFKNLVRLSS